jgi:16S rRNA (adenine1518-N6/adenine1519-N6)-dimethyltransferase
MIATLQLEVAQRLMAQTGDEGYGVLSLLVQSRYEPRGLFKIPAGCFFPSPDVESACIRLDRRVPDLLPAGRQNDFVKLVKLAFSQRRKMMLKLLKGHWPEEQLRESFAELGLSPQTRAEAVSLAQFATLAQRLSSDLCAPKTCARRDDSGVR